MRILHINGRYFSAGGAETYLATLTASQRQSGHDVHVLFASDPPEGASQGHQVHFISPSFGIRSGLRHRRAFLNLVRDLRPDIIHCHVIQYSVSPLILNALARSYATVYTVHDTLAFCLKEPLSLQDVPLARVLPSGKPCRDPVGRPCFHNGCHRQLLEHRGWSGGIGRFASVFWRLRALRRLGKFVVNSEFTRRELIQNGFSPQRIDIIQPPLALPDSWREAIPQRRKDGPTIVYVGHISLIKGVLVLLDALMAISHLRWTVKFVGSGPAARVLREKISTQGLAARAVIEEQVDRDHLGDFYRDADIHVLPSLAPESWGLVGIEAMYFGLPVIASDVGATAEWLKHGQNGLLVPAGDVDALAGALAKLLTDSRLAERLGKEARHYAQRFANTQAQFSERVGNTYLSAITQRAQASENRN